MSDAFTLRPAAEGDTDAMLAIYSPYVEATTVSFEMQPPTPAEFRRRWAAGHEAFPWLCAEEKGELLGYAYAGRLAARPGYNWSVELTIYLAATARGRGVGRRLYTALLALLREQGYCEAYAIITQPGPESEAFHRRMGFRHEGTLRRAGRKQGLVLGISYYALTLKADEGSPPPALPFTALPPGRVAAILQEAGAT